MLADYDVVILGDIDVDARAGDHVRDLGHGRRQPHRDAAGPGPRRPARPDRRGHGPRPTPTSQIDTTRRQPGAGLVERDDPVPRHRRPVHARRRAREPLATLYSSASTATTNPAVTLRSVGSAGGQAAAFTYDLARSVVYTRQGNPAWAGQERDGQLAVRSSASDDLLLPGLGRLSQGRDPAGRRAAAAAGQPDRADEPRPDAAAALLVLPARREGRRRHDRRRPRATTAPPASSTGTRSVSPPGCDVDDWECVRGTSYVYPNTPLSDAAAAAYEAAGLRGRASTSTRTAPTGPRRRLDGLLRRPARPTSRPPSRACAAPTTNRTHCITWSDWATQPKVEAAHGIRLDTNYYYWPAAWVQNRPGLLHRLGHADALRRPRRLDDRRLPGHDPDDRRERHGLPAAHQHAARQRHRRARATTAPSPPTCTPTARTHPGQQTIVNAALARGVPVVSARQMLTWLDGRNGSSFAEPRLERQRPDLLDRGRRRRQRPAGHAARRSGPNGSLDDARRATATRSPFTTQTIKGVEYAVFSAAAGHLRGDLRRRHHRAR